jgi:hypothetical protein
MVSTGILSVLEPAISNERFIHSPAEKNARTLRSSAGCVRKSDYGIRSGIIDKTGMYEAVDNFGLKCAIWVKYRLSLFHYNYNK